VILLFPPLNSINQIIEFDSVNRIDSFDSVNRIDSFDSVNPINEFDSSGSKAQASSGPTERDRTDDAGTGGRRALGEPPPPRARRLEPLEALRGDGLAFVLAGLGAIEVDLVQLTERGGGGLVGFERPHRARPHRRREDGRAAGAR